LTGADAAAFTINSATGAVTFNSSPNFETKSSYSFNVKASDPSGAFNTQAVTLNVTDVAPTITSATSVSVPEGTSTATVVYTAAATDVQGGAVNFSLTGADAAGNPVTEPFDASATFEGAEKPAKKPGRRRGGIKPESHAPLATEIEPPAREEGGLF
jgi:hypothetical protein